jgi:hypothetical protein
MKRGGEGPSNEGAAGEDDIRLPRDKAKATLRRCLENAAQLDQAKRAKYRAAAEAVLDAMGPAALKRWNENVKSITFYPDTESITAFARSQGMDPEHTKAFRGLFMRDPSQPHLCSLHLNGGNDTGNASALKTGDLYAHEFGHAIDWSVSEADILSASAAWRKVSEEEKKNLREWLGVSNRGPAEDFANFAIVALSYQEAARRHYPECWRFWSERGLV